MVASGYGGYRTLPGGSAHFSLHTNRHCIIIYISSSSPWEDPDQRVSPELLILTAPTGGGQPKVGERASQENVRDLDLSTVYDDQ